MSDEKAVGELTVEATEITNKFVDVSIEGIGPSVTVMMSTVDGGAEPMLEIDNDTLGENDEVLEEQRVFFPVSQWEDIKRMGDAAVATYREKFAGPS